MENNADEDSEIDIMRVDEDDVNFIRSSNKVKSEKDKVAAVAKNTTKILKVVIEKIKEEESVDKPQLKNCHVLLEKLVKEEPNLSNSDEVENKITKKNNNEDNCNETDTVSNCICESRHKPKSTLTRYSKKCFSLFNFSCPYCDFTIANSTDGRLLDHIRSKHRRCEIFSWGSVKYCQKYMKRLKKARKNSSGKNSNNFYCPKCPGSYTHASSLKKHNCCKRFACVWCSYSTSRHLDMQIHATIHQ